MKDLAYHLSMLGRLPKRAVMIGYDVGAMLLALWLAFSIRLGVFYVPPSPKIIGLMALAILLGVAALIVLGIYRVVIRYFDTRASAKLAIGAAAVAGIWFMLAYVSRVAVLPRSVGFIYFAAFFLLMYFGRLAASQLLSEAPTPRSFAQQRAANEGRQPAEKPINVAVHGANASASSLAESLRRNPRYRLRFFVDDRPELVGRTMAGHPIFAPARLRREVEAGRIEQVFLAMPSSTRSERMTALAKLAGMTVPVMTVPSYEELMSGRYSISDVRPINVEDLLKRDVVPPLPHLIEGDVKGRSILVTGAGGSIGSEICRQLVQYAPKRLVLFDHSEFALYSIGAELQKLCAGLEKAPELVSVVGTLLNNRLVRDTLARHEVDTVFHAAAYKHVPLLELNEVAAVTNNVLGTRILADATVDLGVARLTMISTDKAVRPANVMGCTKRVAELYIQALALQPGNRTDFGIVRFGNVLDSSGSVVQQFRQQISAGGPVTVTHPDITRFFMSIPEATQLVLQANSLASRGEVFVLDMGEPVRIADLARTMVALSGMSEKTNDHPAGDIEIIYVGLRPGEKLYEELFIGESVADTAHPQIKMATERFVPLEQLKPLLRRLEMALEAHDARAARIVLRNILERDFPAAAEETRTGAAELYSIGAAGS